MQRVLSALPSLSVSQDFFQSFGLGEVLRQGTPVKIFKGEAKNPQPGGGPTVFAIKRVRKLMLKNSKKQELFREVLRVSRNLALRVS